MAMLAEFDGGPAHIEPQDDLWTWLSLRLKENPDSEVIRSMYQSPYHLRTLARSYPSQCATWTFRQLNEASSTLAAHLTKAGLRPLDHVACFIYSSIEYGLLMWTCFKLHAVFVPLDPGEPMRQAQFRDLMEQIRPSVVVAWDGQVASHIDKFNLHLKMRIICNMPDISTSKRWLDLQSLLLDAQSGWNRIAYLQRFRPSTSDLALIMFTSGTTSSPKGCPYTKSNIQFRSKMVYSYRMRTCISSSCFRAAHQSAALLSWRSGGCIIVPSREYEPDALMRALRAEKCTGVALFPSLMRDLARLFTDEESGELQLRNVTLTGDIIDASTRDLCQTTLKPKMISTTYGMTESVGNWVPILPLTLDANGFVAAGRVAPGSKAKVIDQHTRDVLQIGSIGELHISTPCCIDRYLDGRLDELWYTDHGTRWFNTGDLGYFNESGLLFITGRSKDVIVKKGLNIFPPIIEGCLNQDERIEVSQIIGIPHSHYGAVPVAVVKMASDLVNDELAELWEELDTKIIKEQGDDMKVERFLTLDDLHFVDWPYNSTGKILKGELVKRVMAVSQ